MSNPLPSRLRADTLTLASDEIRVDPTTDEQHAAAWACLARHDATDLADALGIPKEVRR